MGKNSMILPLTIALVFISVGATDFFNPSFDVEPQFFQVVARHGDRTPISVYKPLKPWFCEETYLSHGDRSGATTHSLPYPNRLYRHVYTESLLPGNCSTGRLTRIGAKQHQQLGAYYRKRYVSEMGILPSTFDNSKVQIRSTDVPRTVLSAENFITGMYPELSQQSTQVVNIHSRTFDVENLIVNTQACPNVNKAVQSILNGPVFKARNKQLQTLANHLLSVFDIAPPIKWTHIFDWLFARHSHGYPLYPGVSDEQQQQVFDQANWYMANLYSAHNVSRLGLGYFLTEIIQNMRDFQANPKLEPFRLFLAHDTSVGPLLIALRIFDGQWPPYASHIEFGLWKNKTDGEFYVTVGYQGQYINLPHQSQPFIRFQDFVQLYSNVTPTPEEYKTECFR